ncbi:hypothetical protein CEXT_181931 [Caerostris extrusa]|uniref:Uncharacterized protein n=1 Tax=Caerostris extrusa TaxID=172846 RepID=A0AAV4QK78_CAEEX|nr:hypothetical protein CEXT_181931 [Caerostris extrusa]
MRGRRMLVNNKRRKDAAGWMKKERKKKLQKAYKGGENKRVDDCASLVVSNRYHLFGRRPLKGLGAAPQPVWKLQTDGERIPINRVFFHAASLSPVYRSILQVSVRGFIYLKLIE